ncbi:MAG: DUF1800 domain-containing protein [Xanthomonadales bacterium]|nr:DUF1800 domain-containing protein [Xanthomonadales bacterium]
MYNHWALRVGACALLLAALPLVAATPDRLPGRMFGDGMEDLVAGPFNDEDAARFLAQSTFGPTDADIARLRQLRYAAWLDEQFNAAATSQMAYYNWVDDVLDENTGTTTLREGWFLAALGGPDPQNNLIIHRDQLRQRVAFALSEIFVVSDQNALLSQFPNGLSWYYDVLVNNAFGNFRTLLEQVTLSPAMGVYLNMLGNPRANLAQNVHPDENYAREVNQLFSIGLVMLNADGSPQLNGGQPVPTYQQAVVKHFAHVFTGWNWSDCDSGNFLDCGPDWTTGANFETPMAAFPDWHDNGTQAGNDIPVKQLLSYPGAVNGGVLAAGGTPQSDLAFALDNIFRHPNVGPYIGKQLIQRLVTSNPSPAYVARITAVFNDDGSPAHVRGNLKEVVRAILLDPEARYGHLRQPETFGKLREPLLRLTHFWRAMGARHHCGRTYSVGGVTYHYQNQPYRYAGYVTAWGTSDSIYGSGVAQAPLNAFSVFNFFQPDYAPPGEVAAAGLVAPEFQLHTDTLVANSTNSTAGKSFGLDIAIACDPDEDIGDVKIDRAQDAALAGNANGGPGDPPTRLIDAYNLRFLSGQMTPFMRQTLLTALNPVSSADGPDWRFQRIHRALLLIQTSAEYMVQK